MIKLFLVVLVFVSFLPILPSRVDQGRDGGIYAYTAQVIADDGGVPYQDAWDNKPPGIYYIDALAFKLLGVNRWSLWLMELLFVAVMTLLFYGLLQNLTQNQWSALGGTVFFLLYARHTNMIGHGNLTENYALLPQVICFVLGYRFLQKPQLWSAWWFGVSAALALLIKQTTVGVAFAIIPALLLANHPVIRSPKRWHYLAAVTLGGLVTLGVVGAYFASQGILDDMVNAAFISSSKLHQWRGGPRGYSWETIERTLRAHTFKALFLPLVPFAIYALLRVRRDHPMLVWALLTAVADVALLNISNRGYSHYYITLVPAMALIIMLAIQRLPSRRWMLVGAWVYVGIMGLSAANAAVEKYIRGDGPLFGPQKEEIIADYIEANTDLDDTVLVWGASSDLNFQAERDSPTQYHYAYALIVPDYTEEADIEEFIDDLEESQPPMIIDRAVSDGPWVPPLGEDDREAWIAEGGRTDTADLEQIFEFVEDFCSPTDELDGAVIYACDYNPDFW